MTSAMLSPGALEVALFGVPSAYSGKTPSIPKSSPLVYSSFEDSFVRNNHYSHIRAPSIGPVGERRMLRGSFSSRDFCSSLRFFIPKQRTMH
jgi:hypothetical protein